MYLAHFAICYYNLRKLLNGFILVIQMNGLKEKKSNEGSNLSISSVSKTDFGIYKCHAFNEIVSISTKFRIVQKYTTESIIEDLQVFYDRNVATLKWKFNWNGIDTSLACLKPDLHFLIK